MDALAPVSERRFGQCSGMFFGFSFLDVKCRYVDRTILQTDVTWLRRSALRARFLLIEKG
jgi:hypothetical protein